LGNVRYLREAAIHSARATEATARPRAQTIVAAFAEELPPTTRC
jgi:hypothetical protein